MDRSVFFYQSIGFTLQNRWGNHYAQLVAPGLVIGLHPGNSFGGSGKVSIGFTTENLEETKVALEKVSILVKERKEEGGTSFISMILMARRSIL